MDYFAPGSYSITFGPGQRSARLVVPLVQDAAVEGGEAFRAYMNGRKVTPDDPLLPRLDHALTRPDLKPHDRATLHFARIEGQGRVLSA